MSRASKILESLKKRTKISEGWAASSKMNAKIEKEILNQNKDRDVGDIALDIEGNEIEDSVILAKNHGSVDFAYAIDNDRVSVDIHNDGRGEQFSVHLTKKQLKLLLNLF